MFDLLTGQEKWVHLDAGVRFYEFLGGEGPRTTPTIVDGKVYALGATGHLSCLDLATGERNWQRDILADAKAENIMWGMAGSPLVFDDKVVVNPGGANGHSLVAYDKTTGDIVWHAGSGRGSYEFAAVARPGGRAAGGDVQWSRFGRLSGRRRHAFVGISVDHQRRSDDQRQPTAGPLRHCPTEPSGCSSPRVTIEATSPCCC